MTRLPGSHVLAPALIAVGAFSLPGAAAHAQSLQDPSRLGGMESVRLEVEAAWDELITTEVGGATPDQFLEALRMTFDAGMSEADAAPVVAEEAPTTVICHVDTFYDHPLIVYSLRVQTQVPGANGPVVTWIKSWVGSFTVQQLHLMFQLGDQCAESFLEDWREAN